MMDRNGAYIHSSGTGGAIQSYRTGREFTANTHRDGTSEKVSLAGRHFFSPKDQHEIFRNVWRTCKRSVNDFVKHVNERSIGFKTSMRGQPQNIAVKGRDGQVNETVFQRWVREVIPIAGINSQTDCRGQSRPITSDTPTKLQSGSTSSNPAVAALKENSSSGITLNQTSIPIGQIVGGVIKCLGNVIGFITGLISDVVALVLNLISSLVTALLEELTNVLDELVGYIDTATAALESVVNSLTLGITNLFESGVNSLNQPGGGESEVNNMLASSYGCFLSALPNVGSFFSRLLNH